MMLSQQLQVKRVDTCSLMPRIVKCSNAHFGHHAIVRHARFDKTARARDHRHVNARRHGDGGMDG